MLDDYFEGESTLYTVEHIQGWLVQVLFWSAFIAIIWFILICVNVVIRAQWTEKEKLAYPIIQLPLEMTEKSSSFLKNKGMWVGFTVAGSLELLAGLHYLFPSIPAIQVNYYSIRHLFTDKPWNRIGGIYLSAYPFIIGLTFFVPLDISFSAWVFFLAKKIERIIRLGILGTDQLHFFERSAGAWLAVGILALWSTRHHLYQVWQKICNSASPIDDSQEPMKYRTAIIGIIIGMGFLILFSYKAGMTFWIIGVFLAIYFIVAIAVARVRAEFGPPSHEILHQNPTHLMTISLGIRSIGARNLTVLSFYYWLNRLSVSHPMPNQLEAFKIAERTRISSKRLVWVMMLATLVGGLACFWAYLHVLYQAGASSASGYIEGIGWEVFNRLENWLNNPTGPDSGAIRSIGVGFLITVFLYFLRHRFFWWPFHPIGYVMTAATWGGLSDYWFSVFIGWFIKVIIVKQFGLKTHRRVVPFFLGLVLGDYVVASAWSLIGVIFHIPTYVLWSP